LEVVVLGGRLVRPQKEKTESHESGSEVHDEDFLSSVIELFHRGDDGCVFQGSLHLDQARLFGDTGAIHLSPRGDNRCEF
jgi:hypothetical protein